LGGNLFVPSAASGEPLVATPGADGTGTIRQGFAEMSNVQIVEEMVAMIVAQRAYEINSKTIMTVEEMLRTATNISR
jgi:flagellar basal-body rod protein FlgG